MKHVLLTLFLIPALGFGQDTALSFSKTEIVEMDKSAIYNKAKLWTVALFSNTRGAIQVDDKENGMLAFDATTTALSPNAPKVAGTSDRELRKLLPFYHQYVFKFSIQIKDGKYKIDLTDINIEVNNRKHQLTSSKKAPYKYASQEKVNADWADTKITFENFAETFINSLHQAVIKKDNW